MNWLNQLVSEGDGSPSTMRIAVLVIVIGFVVTWAVTSIEAGTMQPVDMAQASVILGALGMKAVQRKVENSTPTEAK